MFDFPSSPSTGTIFSPAGGPQYLYDGQKWKLLGSGRTAQARNRVTNPCMAVSQENGRTTSANSINNAAYYGADQWYGRWNFASGAFRCTSSDAGGVNGLASIYIGIVTAKPSLAATGEYAILTTRFEGLQMSDFLWGTPQAKQVVVRFSAKATALPGTYCMRFVNNGGGRSFIAPFTITTANVMQDFSIVIPGDTVGTWPTDNSWSGQLDFIIASSPGYQGVAGWQDGSLQATAAQVNGASVVQNFFIANVGLYLDPLATGVAPPFQVPDYGDDLRACQRYYETGTDNWGGYATSGSDFKCYTAFKETKRATPTMALIDGGSINFPAVASTAQYTSTTFFSSNRTASGTGGAVYSDTWKANARM